jgi:chromosome segregation ATPase
MNLSKFLLFFFLLLATACVPAKKYKELQSRYDAKDVEIAEAKATIFTLQKQLEEAQEEKKALTQDLRKLTSSSKAGKDKDEQISSLEQKIRVLEAKIASLEKNQANTTKTAPKDNKTKKPKNAY